MADSSWNTPRSIASQKDSILDTCIIWLHVYSFRGWRKGIWRRLPAIRYVPPVDLDKGI
jgi:hypothetical protein